METFSLARRLAAVLTLVIGLTAAVHAAEPFHGARASRDHYGAIFQIDSGSPGAIKKTLNNIENLLGDPRLKGKIRIELIANAQGFAVYVKNNGFEDRLKKLQAQGVLLAQCANTLRELHIDRNDLYPFISVVPSGMGEITLRESEGWAYIHPTPPDSSM